ncbi:MAG: hypothetical protein IR164_15275 [Devosia sp.]|uniref:hypothetical protein n=1 Tax=unclassified Devosia TaxID=196773 RepID=UPI0019F091F2|nr:MULTISPECIES: hypothetical protein [unclassified Devosia]MBF0680287.1 hypothetical protein [Devosia sp.]WEJ32797.1 hypothetical protein NYQ88_18245 [Devosia sp. SD17-2]
MADYKELLRRAISALPENNGAARRAVYEKARSALVGQLRAIQPPLPAREITQHRLQLEDCIRQVEQEASEAVISLGREAMLAAKPTAPAPQVAQAPAAPDPVVPEPPPVVASAPKPVVTPPVEKPRQAPEPIAKVAKPEPPAPKVEAAPSPETKPQSPESDILSIEAIIGEAASVTGAKVETINASGAVNAAPEPELKATPDLAPEPTALDGKKSEDKKSDEPVAPPVVFPASTRQPIPLKTAGPSSPRDGSLKGLGNSAAMSPAIARVEPVISGNAALARQTNFEPVLAEDAPVEAALSSVREVEVEADEAREAEGAIERAIETLDREARGEATSGTDTQEQKRDALGDALAVDDSGFAVAEAETERRSSAGLTIFLVVFALLLAGVGGAGFWAWREGYVDLDQMFGTAQAPVTQNVDVPIVAPTPSLDGPQPAVETGVNSETGTGPGNTATNTPGEPTTALEGLEADDRLEPTPEPVTPTGAETALPSLNGAEKTEERLSGDDTTIAANDPAASVDPAVLAGSQSLLLEASADGRTGAVPFSGTVDWEEGVDEVGLPTLVAQASIPARNLSVGVTIRKNADPSLPASHLMEVAFNIPDTFIGGSISSLPGVLLKDEELVPGTPLVGASARIVGNSFLFALSASPEDAATNVGLLESRRWVDLAVIYGTGRNAILTLEKDEEAQALFEKVFARWAE